MESNSKIFVAGHRGLLGSALVRQLNAQGYHNVITVDRSQLNLADQSAVDAWFATHRPEFVFMAAAQVFGIGANVSGEVILNNLRVEVNVIDAARRNGCKKLLFPGSNCVYPKFARTPITEDQLLTGALEPTSESYAAAKIAGIMMCRHFKKQWGFNAVSVMPCNLYGPNDNYSPLASHVIPGLIAKLHAAKIKGDPTYSCWGTGSALREFLHSDDLADAAITLAEMSEVTGLVNVGYGSDISIKDLVYKVARVVGYKGEILWDPSKPDGTPRKILDSGRLRHLTSWTPKISLDEGLPLAYQDFLAGTVRT